VVTDQSSPQSRRRSVTSIDVARAAGVSQSTVSLVISGKATGRVSDETQLLVEETAQRLGYIPNASARMLRGGSPRVIALAVPNVRHEYFARVLLAAEHAARQREMAVILVDTASGPEWVERLIAMSRTGLLAGAIVYAEEPEGTLHLGQSLDNVVFVECVSPGGRPAIDIDIADAMRQVVAHLHSLGHRRIGHARASMARETFRLRSEHLRAALAKRGISLRPAWEYESDFDLEGATERAVAFLRETPVTAVFCDDDFLAASLYRAARLLDLRIPDDLSVVGFNDIDLTRYLSPELTSVSIPAADVGETAVRTLIGPLEGPVPPVQTLPLSLIVRGSTGRVRRARSKSVPD